MFISKVKQAALLKKLVGLSSGRYNQCIHALLVGSKNKNAQMSIMELINIDLQTQKDSNYSSGFLIIDSCISSSQESLEQIVSLAKNFHYKVNILDAAQLTNPHPFMGLHYNPLRGKNHFELIDLLCSFYPQKHPSEIKKHTNIFKESLKKHLKGTLTFAELEKIAVRELSHLNEDPINDGQQFFKLVLEISSKINASNLSNMMNFVSDDDSDFFDLSHILSSKEFNILKSSKAFENTVEFDLLKSIISSDLNITMQNINPKECHQSNLFLGCNFLIHQIDFLSMARHGRKVGVKLVCSLDEIDDVSFFNLMIAVSHSILFFSSLQPVIFKDILAINLYDPLRFKVLFQKMNADDVLVVQTTEIDLIAC